MISTEITRIQGAKSDIATAIENKGVTVPSGTKIDGMAALIDQIDNVKWGEAPDNDVIFIDYDGTILYSYSKAEFANLTALPANPTRAGLIADGWNWTLADAKSYVAANDELVIGQNYHPTDGKTHVWIRLSEDYHTPYIGLGVNGTVTIEWGDGVSANSTLTGTSVSTAKYAQAPYTKGGDYEIKISLTSGSSYRIFGTSDKGSILCTANNADYADNYQYLYSVIRIWMGNNCSVGTASFYHLANLESLCIPGTSKTPAAHCFRNTNKLRAIVLPSGSSSSSTYNFQYCYAQYISLPKSWTGQSNYQYRYCYFLRRFNLTPSMTTIAGSYWAGDMGRSMNKLIIPATVTSLTATNMLNGAGIKKLIFKGATPPSAAATTFNGLPTTCIISVPTGKLSTYTGADNYPDSSTYTYIQE